MTITNHAINGVNLTIKVTNIQFVVHLHRYVIVLCESQTVKIGSEPFSILLGLGEFLYHLIMFPLQSDRSTSSILVDFYFRHCIQPPHQLQLLLILILLLFLLSLLLLLILILLLCLLLLLLLLVWALICCLPQHFIL